VAKVAKMVARVVRVKEEEMEDDPQVVILIDPQVVIQVEPSQLTNSLMPTVSQLEGNLRQEILMLASVSSSNRASVPKGKIVSFGIQAFVGCLRQAIVNLGKSAYSSTPKALLWLLRLRPSLKLRLQRRKPKPMTLRRRLMLPKRRPQKLNLKQLLPKRKQKPLSRGGTD